MCFVKMELLALLVAFISGTIFVHGCDNFKSVQGDSGYCICNSTYCDKVPNVTKTQDPLDYTMISSSKNGLRFNVTTGKFRNTTQERRFIRIIVDNTKTYQTMMGFGGSLTDSVGINLDSLSEGARENLLRSYFGSESIEYNFIRVPLGVSDFSLRGYSYAMTENDTDLQHFSLVEEDHQYKIPYLKKIRTMSKREVKLLASPWAPSPWMKTGGGWNGNGYLRPEYWSTWANYFVKFFQAYKNNTVNFWGLTLQNEPLLPELITASMPSLTWRAKEMREWASKFLGPALKNANLTNIKLIAGDGQRALLNRWIPELFENKETKDLFSGIAAHWYFDWLTSVRALERTHTSYPDKFIIYTEASTGLFQHPPVLLGSWSRAEDYAKNIIENLSHWVTGWIDWNMALNTEGGPTWVNNFLDAAVIVNATNDEFYKQPLFYIMGHFSKFIPPDSLRISTTKKGVCDIKSLAFTTPDKATVVILFNNYNREKVIILEDASKGSVKLSLPPKSIHSITYW